MTALVSVWRSHYLTVLLVLAGVACAALCGLMIGNDLGNLVIFAVLLVPALLIILLSAEAALILIVLGVFSLEFLAGKGLLPVAGLWTVDILIVALLARLIVLKGRTTGWFWRSRLWLPMLIWTLLMLASGVSNATPVVQVILGLRPFIRFFVLAFCILEFPWREGFLGRPLHLLVILMLLQLPIMIVEDRTIRGYDGVFGTISSQGGTGLISLLAVCFCGGLLAYALFARRPRFLWPCLALLAIPPLASARAFLFIIPAIVLYLLLRLMRHVALWQLGLFGLGVVLMVLNWTALQGRTSFREISDVSLFTDPSPAIRELMMGPVANTKGGSIGRVAGVMLTWDRITDAPATLLLGFGPAAAQASRFAGIESSAYQDLALSGARASQLTKSLTEWGLLGTLAYALIFLVLFWEAEKAYRAFQDPFWKATAFGYSLFVLLSVFLVGYTSVWTATVAAFLFWFVGSVLMRQAYATAEPIPARAKPDLEKR